MCRWRADLSCRKHPCGHVYTTRRTTNKPTTGVALQELGQLDPALQSYKKVGHNAYMSMHANKSRVHSPPCFLSSPRPPHAGPLTIIIYTQPLGAGDRRPLRARAPKPGGADGGAGPVQARPRYIRSALLFPPSERKQRILTTCVEYMLTCLPLPSLRSRSLHSARAAPGPQGRQCPPSGG